MKRRVATVGDNCIDRYGPPISLSTVGGNAVNVAVHLSRLGGDSAYFGAVGDDDAGKLVLGELVANGVEIGGVRIEFGSTAFTELSHDSRGDRVIGLEEFGVCRGYRPSEQDFHLLKRMSHVHLGWIDDGGACKARLKSMGVAISQDLAVNDGAWDLDVAFASAGSSRDRALRLLRRALDQGATLAVVTMGPLGSLASDGTFIVEVGAQITEVVDTLGAGDTFIGGFLAARISGRDIKSCLEAGRDAAALTCTHLGGFTQVPFNTV